MSHGSGRVSGAHSKSALRSMSVDQDEADENVERIHEMIAQLAAMENEKGLPKVS